VSLRLHRSLVKFQNLVLPLFPSFSFHTQTIPHSPLTPPKPRLGVPPPYFLDFKSLAGFEPFRQLSINILLEPSRLTVPFFLHSLSTNKYLQFQPTSWSSQPYLIPFPSPILSSQLVSRKVPKKFPFKILFLIVNASSILILWDTFNLFSFPLVPSKLTLEFFFYQPGFSSFF